MRRPSYGAVTCILTGLSLVLLGVIEWRTVDAWIASCTFFAALFAFAAPFIDGDAFADPER